MTEKEKQEISKAVGVLIKHGLPISDSLRSKIKKKLNEVTK